MPCVAILDDYAGMALELADWSPVRSRSEVTVFDRPLKVPDEAAQVLQPFDAISRLCRCAIEIGGKPQPP